jgi:hypothetical protein
MQTQAGLPLVTAAEDGSTVRTNKVSGLQDCHGWFDEFLSPILSRVAAGHIVS